MVLKGRKWLWTSKGIDPGYRQPFAGFIILSSLCHLVSSLPLSGCRLHSHSLSKPASLPWLLTPLVYPSQFKQPVQNNRNHGLAIRIPQKRIWSALFELRARTPCYSSLILSNPWAHQSGQGSFFWDEEYTTENKNLSYCGAFLRFWTSPLAHLRGSF